MNPLSQANYNTYNHIKFLGQGYAKPLPLDARNYDKNHIIAHKIPQI